MAHLHKIIKLISKSVYACATLFLSHIINGTLIYGYNIGLLLNIKGNYYATKSHIPKTTKS